MEKTKPNTTKACIHQSKEMYYNKKYTLKKLKSGLVTSYDIRPGNGEDLFWFWRFKNFSFTYSDTYPLTYSPGTHTGLSNTDIYTFTSA